MLIDLSFLRFKRYSKIDKKGVFATNKIKLNLENEKKIETSVYYMSFNWRRVRDTSI